MPGVEELKARVAGAEGLWSAGRAAEAHESFASLLSDFVLEHREVANFGENEFLVMDRYADLSAEIGEAPTALSLYHVLQERALDSESRASAGFKRLHLAVDAGEAFVALHAFESIWKDTGLPAPPLDASDAELAGWEAGIPWRASDRAALFCVMYLAVGKLHQAFRRVPQSSVWLTRGLWHAERAEGRLARLSAIPLRLARARNHLCMGCREPCREDLDRAADSIEREALGAVYGIWLDQARARMALLEGRLGDALAHLVALERAAVERGLLRAAQAALVAQAEVLILLNFLDEARLCLDEASRLARSSGDAEMLAQVARVQFVRASRAQMFGPDDVGESVARLHDPSEPGDSPRPVAPGSMNEDELVWTGDCLRDYERREAVVYAELAGRAAMARDDLADLARDFEGVDSPLIRARLRALAGLLFARYGDVPRAADHFDEARVLFEGIGAERELYQTTAYLILAVERDDQARYHRLIDENDRRLARLEASLSTEQRNAFRLNKYTAAEQKLRADIEAVLALQDRALAARWWCRPFRYARYWAGVHDLLAALDEERAQQRRTTAPGSAAGRQRRGVAGMLWRVSRHPPHHLTVGHVILPDMAFVFSVGRWRMDLRPLRVDRLGVRALVSGLHRTLMDPERTATAAFDERAESACDILGLAEIVRTAPADVTDLTIVSDGDLRLLPFCALRHVGSDGRGTYLVDRYALSIDNVTHRRRPAASGSEKAAVGYTGRDLQEARGAAAAASEWLRTEWQLTGTPTDERSACLSALRRARFFYYFGHGRFRDGDPDGSGLEFRGAAGPEMLTLRDLDAIDCGDLEQAMILACHGSDARSFPGRWVVSLPDILLRRGARSVLAALWEVAEPIAGEVSRRFLDQAPRQGRAQALAEIQRDLARRWRDPYWWAGFQVYGDARRW